MGHFAETLIKETMQYCTQFVFALHFILFCIIKVSLPDFFPHFKMGILRFLIYFADTSCVAKVQVEEK